MSKDIGLKMKKLEVNYTEQHGIKVKKWVDKQLVLMITSNPSHTSTLLKTEKKIRVVRKFSNKSV